MRAPVSWLRELVEVDPGRTGVDIAADLVKVGLEEEGLHGGDIVGPLVVGRVLDVTDEPQKNGKTIHFCHVDVGNTGQRAAAGGDPSVTQEIVCGAHNFGPGDLVVVVLPGATLPGGFEISARKTYGHMSNGMICSAAELGLGEDHDGIIVLSEYFADSRRSSPGSSRVRTPSNCSAWPTRSSRSMSPPTAATPSRSAGSPATSRCPPARPPRSATRSASRSRRRPRTTRASRCASSTTRPFAGTWGATGMSPGSSAASTPAPRARRGCRSA